MFFEYILQTFFNHVKMKLEIFYLIMPWRQSTEKQSDLVHQSQVLRKCWQNHQKAKQSSTNFSWLWWWYALTLNHPPETLAKKAQQNLIQWNFFKNNLSKGRIAKHKEIKNLQNQHLIACGIKDFAEQPKRRAHQIGTPSNILWWSLGWSNIIILLISK